MTPILARCRGIDVHSQRVGQLGLLGRWSGLEGWWPHCRDEWMTYHLPEHGDAVSCYLCVEVGPLPTLP